MIFLKQYSLSIQGLILSAIIVGSATVITTGFALIWPKISKNKVSLIYAFSAGFILPLAILGLAGTGLEKIIEYFNNHNQYNQVVENLIACLIVVSGGILGFGIYIGTRHLILSRTEIHKNHSDHSHPEHVVNLNEIDAAHSKWTAVFLIVLHRIPAGLTIGLLAYTLNQTSSNDALNLGVLIAFIVHVIPEALIIYYRQVEIGRSKWRALGFALGAKLIIIPFIFIGLFLGEAIESQFWLMPLILVAGGVLMSMTAITELFPELFHGTLNDKRWHAIVYSIAAGIILSIVILVFHHH